MRFPSLSKILFGTILTIYATFPTIGCNKENKSDSKISQAGLIQEIIPNSDLSGLEIKCSSLTSKEEYTVNYLFKGQNGLHTNDNLFLVNKVGIDTLYLNPDGSLKRIGFVKGFREQGYVADLMGDGKMYLVFSNKEGIHYREIKDREIENTKHTIVRFNEVGIEDISSRIQFSLTSNNVPDIVIPDPKFYGSTFHRHIIFRNKGNGEFIRDKDRMFRGPML
jgi:hypothetical protein